MRREQKDSQPSFSEGQLDQYTRTLDKKLDQAIEKYDRYPEQVEHFSELVKKILESTPQSDLAYLLYCLVGKERGKGFRVTDFLDQKVLTECYRMLFTQFSGAPRPNSLIDEQIINNIASRIVTEMETLALACVPRFNDHFVWKIEAVITSLFLKAEELEHSPQSVSENFQLTEEILANYQYFFRLFLEKLQKVKLNKRRFYYPALQNLIALVQKINCDQTSVLRPSLRVLNLYLLYFYDIGLIELRGYDEYKTEDLLTHLGRFLGVHVDLAQQELDGKQGEIKADFFNRSIDIDYTVERFPNLQKKAINEAISVCENLMKEGKIRFSLFSKDYYQDTVHCRVTVDAKEKDCFINIGDGGSILAVGLLAITDFIKNKECYKTDYHLHWLVDQIPGSSIMGASIFDTCIWTTPSAIKYASTSEGIRAHFRHEAMHLYQYDTIPNLMRKSGPRELEGMLYALDDRVDGSALIDEEGNYPLYTWSMLEENWVGQVGGRYSCAWWIWNRVFDQYGNWVDEPPHQLVDSLEDQAKEYPYPNFDAIFYSTIKIKNFLLSEDGQAVMPIKTGLLELIAVEALISFPSLLPKHLDRLEELKGEDRLALIKANLKKIGQRPEEYYLQLIKILDESLNVPPLIEDDSMARRYNIYGSIGDRHGQGLKKPVFNRHTQLKREIGILLEARFSSQSMKLLNLIICQYAKWKIFSLIQADDQRRESRQKLLDKIRRAKHRRRWRFHLFAGGQRIACNPLQDLHNYVKFMLDVGEFS
jgi:hypothetical protein